MEWSKRAWSIAAGIGARNQKRIVGAASMAMQAKFPG
jgi:hypothetical protein